MINPMKLMKIKNAWSRFAANHPKFPLFLNAIVKKGIQEETIFEFKVTYPDGQQLVTNMRLRAEDIGRFADVLIDCTGAALIWVLVYLFSRPSRISRAA